MQDDCIFCKIAAKEIPAAKIRYEDTEIIAFDDINPKAKVHILFVPKKHIENLNEAKEEDTMLLGKLIKTARDLAQKLAIDESGYRLIINTKEHAGAAVDHLHLHLLGGEALGRMVNK